MKVTTASKIDKISIRPNRSLFVLKLLVLVSLIVVLVQVVLKYISIVGYNEQHGFLFELSNRFDFNDENSVPQWLTQALFLAIAGAAFLAAYITKGRPKSRLWLVIGAAGVILSIDDVATLHEFVLQSLHNVFFVDTAPGLLRNTWLLILPVILAALVFLLLKAVRLLPRRTTVVMAAGSLIFIIGAVAVDSLANTVPERSFIGQGVLGAVEGGLQLTGSAVFLYAVMDYLERHHDAVIKRALRTLRA